MLIMDCKSAHDGEDEYSTCINDMQIDLLGLETLS